MITCAVYARKSTDQNVTEEEKSVTRQVEHARTCAIRKGWRWIPDRPPGLERLLR
jgi:DNA invertase Pin-like site-specific DNA recombinase